jgi:hypothetical protein
MRPVLMWSDGDLHYQLGLQGDPLEVAPASERLGSPEPRSLVSYRAGRAGSSRFCLAVKPGVSDLAQRAVLA